MEKLEKNFLWLSAANITASLFNILLFIYLARTLQAESFGRLSYAMTFVFYLFNFVDFGLSTYGTREIARDKSKVSEYVSNILSFRTIIGGALFLGFVLIIFLSYHSLTLKILMAETALMLFISCLATEWAFQGMEKMNMIFISLVTTSFLQFALNFLFIKSPADLLKVPIINFLAAFPIIIIFLKHFNFRFHIKNINFKHVRVYLGSSMVFWAISVFAQAYNNLDIVLLGFFRKPEEVGCFTIARRIAGGITLLMVFLANAVLPRLSFTFGRDKKQFDSATRKFLKISVFVIVFIILPVIFFSSAIISLTVGDEYIPASIPLKLMAIALVFVLFNLPFSTGLIAAGFESDVLKQAFACAALSIISNFILMPKYGMIGASISFLLAEAMAFVWILKIYKEKITGKEE